MTAKWWLDDIKLGIGRIDSEHRIFLRLVRAYTEGVAAALDRERLRRMIKEIRKFAEFHFMSEEHLMLELEYPEYRDHQDAHRHLLSQLEDFGHEIAVGAKSYVQLADFLCEWFALHATTEDRQIADFIAANPEAQQKLAGYASPL